MFKADEAVGLRLKVMAMDTNPMHKIMTMLAAMWCKLMNVSSAKKSAPFREVRR